MLYSQKYTPPYCFLSNFVMTFNGYFVFQWFVSFVLDVQETRQNEWKDQCANVLLASFSQVNIYKQIWQTLYNSNTYGELKSLRVMESSNYRE